MSEFKLDTREEGDVVVITTEGYLNNVGGEKIAEACYEKINGGKNKFLLNMNVNISTNLLNKNCPNIANNVEVKILENNDNFTEQDWKSLYQLSEKTFVEETESLKKGAAGAGLTDND